MTFRTSPLSRREFVRLSALGSATVLLGSENAHAKELTPYQNPVYAGLMPDPGVVKFDGKYYAFGTTGESRLEDGRIFRVLASPDLVHWEELGGALETPFPQSDLHYWAPEVVHHEGTFYLYYSVGTVPEFHFGIRVATSKRPQGPYIDSGNPLEEGENAPFFIDGHPFRDDDGSWYFFYAKNFLDDSSGYKVGTGIVVDRLLGMTRLEGNPRLVVRPRFEWTLFEANRKMASHGDQLFDWHTIEAPWIVKYRNKYYCFYSGSNFGTINYGLDYVVADSVTGPYRNQGRYARVLRGVPDLVRGPGHHSVVTAPDGKTQMIVYHAWNQAMTERQMCIDPLVWTPRGPRCIGPTVSTQELLRRTN